MNFYKSFLGLDAFVFVFCGLELFGGVPFCGRCIWGWPSKAPFLFWGKAAMMPARSLNKAMMLKGKIDEYIRNFYAATRNALLVTGARQTGKTYSIREFGKTFKSFIEIILRTT